MWAAVINYRRLGGLNNDSFLTVLESGNRTRRLHG